MMKKLLYVMVLMCLAGSISEAQILNRVLRKTENKLADKLAEKLVEKIFLSVDDDIDESHHEAYKRDSINGDTSGSFSEYMKRLSEGVEIPESYTFDIAHEIEYTDEKGKTTRSTNYYSENNAYFGIMQTDKKGKESITIFDSENEILVMYDNDKKTCSAVPSMLNFASGFASEEIEKYDYTTIEKTGKTKRIAGYNAEEYYVESQVYKGNTYISNEVNINMGEQFSKMFASYMPETTRRMSEVNGLALASEIINKEDGDRIETTTISVTKKTIRIDSSDYKQENKD